MRFLLVATVKDEGPHLLEWIAHHKRIGFDDIVIYQNDSTDFTDRSLQFMAKAGILEYHLNTFPENAVRKPYQNRALQRASRTEAYQNADWCIGLDGDEFLHIKTPEGTLQSLVEAVEGKAGPVDEIRLNWRVFGNSFLHRFDDRLMTERFTRADPEDRILTQKIAVKTLFRTRSFQRPGIHLPKVPLKEKTRFSNGSGLHEEDIPVSGFRSNDPGLCCFARINHYAVRDTESFLLKSARGSASNVGRSIDMRYWRRFNRNQVEELGLYNQLPETRKKMAELDDLTNGRLMGIRNRSLRQWRVRGRMLREDPDYAVLYKRLIKVSQHSAD